MKIKKVKDYWAQKSLLIPNVYFIALSDKLDCDNVLEFQDLSKKEVLVDQNGQKIESGHKLRKMTEDMKDVKIGEMKKRRMSLAKVIMEANSVRT